MEQGLKLVLSADASGFIAAVQEGKATLSSLPNAAKAAGDGLNKMGDEGKSAGDKLTTAFTKPRKTLGELDSQYKRFQQGLKEAKGEESIKRINSALEATKKRIDEIKTLKNPIPPSFAPDAKKATQSLTDLSRIAQDAPYGFIGIANNINPMLESFQRLKAETGSTKTALLSMVQGLTGPAGIGLAIGVVSSLLVKYGDKLFGAKKEVDSLKQAQEEAKKTTEAFVAALSSIDKVKLQGAQDAQKETVALQQLYAASQNQNISLVERKKAVDALQDQYPKYFANIKDEVILAGGAEAAYKNLAAAILSAATARAAQDRLVEIAKRKLELDKQIAVQAKEVTKSLTDQNTAQQRIDRQGAAQRSKESTALINQDNITRAKSRTAGEETKLIGLSREYNALTKEAGDLANVVLQEVQKNGVKVLVGEEAVKDTKVKVAKIKEEIASIAPQMDIVRVINLQLKYRGGEAPQAQLPDLDFNVVPKFDKTSIDQNLDILRGQIENYFIAKFQSLGLELPDLKFASATPLADVQATYQKILDDIKAQIQTIGQAIDGTLTPSIQAFFSAIASNKSPLQAFFDTMKQQVLQLMAQLVAAQIKALVLKAITGAATGGVGTALGNFAKIGASFGGVAAPMGLSGGNSIDRFSRLNNLSFGGSAAQNITVGGRLVAEGGALVAVITSEQKNQRNYF